MWFSLWIVIPIVIFVFAIRYIINTLIPWYRSNQTLWKAIEDVGCVNRHWLFGHIRHFAPTELGLQRMANAMKICPKISPTWLGPFVYYLLAYHPDISRTILASDTPKSKTLRRFLSPWIGDGLLLSDGEKWKRNRRLLTPAFHFDILKHYLVCFNNSACDMFKKWSNTNKNGVTVEMFHDVSAMTLDILLQCILSQKSGCNTGENMKYLDAVKYLTETTIDRLHNPFYHFDWIFYLSPMGKKFKQACKVAHDFTESAIRKRQIEMSAKNGIPTVNSKLDFLDIMLVAKDENGLGLTYKEICDEVDTFVFEGHDTVSSGISYVFYNLAIRPKYQDKCREEVCEVLGKRTTVEYDDLSKFKYLTMCIKESMRIHPPVLTVFRELNEPLICPRGFGADQYNTDPSHSPGPDASKVLPTNMVVGVHIHRLHRNPYIWDNPEVFDPDRFIPENISKRSPHAYIPFSTGSRNCIGQNFAMNEMKVVVALALQRFRFTVDHTFPKPEMLPQVVLRSSTGIHLKVEKL